MHRACNTTPYSDEDKHLDLLFLEPLTHNRDRCSLEASWEGSENRTVAERSKNPIVPPKGDGHVDHDPIQDMGRLMTEVEWWDPGDRHWGSASMVISRLVRNHRSGSFRHEGMGG